MLQKFQSKQLLALLVSALMVVVLIDPLGMSTGSKNNAQYSQIYAQLDVTSDSKVLMIASWNDYYEKKPNPETRSVRS